MQCGQKPAVLLELVVVDAVALHVGLEDAVAADEARGRVGR